MASGDSDLSLEDVSYRFHGATSWHAAGRCGSLQRCSTHHPRITEQLLHLTSQRVQLSEIHHQEITDLNPSTHVPLRINGQHAGVSLVDATHHVQVHLERPIIHSKAVLPRIDIRRTRLEDAGAEMKWAAVLFPALLFATAFAERIIE